MNQISSLKEKIKELERKQKEEEELNKDPFRFLKQRIERNTKLLIDVKARDQKNIMYNPNNYDRNTLQPEMNYYIESIESDKSIIQMFTKLTSEIENLKEQVEDQEAEIEGLKKQIKNDSTDIIDLLSID